MIAAEALTGGFADAVFDAQSAFRAVLTALSQPGRIIDLGHRVRPPVPLAAGAATVIATLADDTTPVFLDATFAGTPAADWIAFHTGAPIADEPGDASFAVIGAPAALADFHPFAPGTAEYPDRSATLILMLDTLTEGARLRLSGPGIDDSATIAPSPLPPDFIPRMTANRALFPRGVDLILTAGSLVAGLPRSTRIAAEAA